MAKRKYLSIGEVSKITGVHIKSLRYYDKIGVLKPAFIDPNSSYRYYTYPQLGIVDAIQTCINLDIPLKEFAEFIAEEADELQMDRLLAYTKQKAEEKIASINEGLERISAYETELKNGESLKNQVRPVKKYYAKKEYYLLPIEDGTAEEDYHALDRIFEEVSEKGFRVGYEFGVLFIVKQNDMEKYQFTEIINDKKINDAHIRSFAPGYYMAKCVSGSRIETAHSEFPDLFRRRYDKVIIESVPLCEVQNTSNFSYELRCLVR